MSRTQSRDLFALVPLLLLLQTPIPSSRHEEVLAGRGEVGPRLSLQVGYAGAVKAVAFSLDGKMVAAGCLGNIVKLWDVRTGLIVRTFATHGSMGVATIAFSLDGKMLATGGPGQDVELWSPQTGELLQTLPEEQHEVWSLAFSPDGRTLATAGGLLWGEIRLWDLESGKAKLDLVSPEKSGKMRSGYSI